ncbi:MAG: hypothetical protein RLZ72_820 [Actinomycetota bacterium]|jgi:hypothetical protein
MALSDDERRVLEEMERHLRASTSDVMDIGPRRRVNATSVTIGLLIVVVGIGILLGGIIMRFTVLGVLGFGAMVAGVLIATNRSGGTSDRRPQAPRVNPKPSKPSSFEERWERRMGGDL